MVHPVEAYSLEKKKNVSRPGRSSPRAAEQGTRKSKIIFISTESVYMNNLLPAGARSFFINALRRNEKMNFLFSVSSVPLPSLRGGEKQIILRLCQSW